MAGVHSYPLLVEFEETKIPRLKIKLVKYFQSKKSNGGGECEVEYENGSSTAMVRFRREEGKFVTIKSCLLYLSSYNITYYQRSYMVTCVCVVSQIRETFWPKSRIRSVWKKAFWSWRSAYPRKRNHHGCEKFVMNHLSTTVLFCVPQICSYIDDAIYEIRFHCW